MLHVQWVSINIRFRAAIGSSGGPESRHSGLAASLRTGSQHVSAGHLKSVLRNLLKLGAHLHTNYGHLNTSYAHSINGA